MFTAISPAAMEMLRFIEAGDDNTRSESDLLEKYGKHDGNYRLEALLGADYVDRVGYHPNAFALSPCGRDFLASEEKRAEDEAERKRDQERKEASDKKLADKRARKDAFRFWVGVVVNVLIAFFSAVIGAVLAVRTDLVDWIVGLFQ